MIGFNGMLLLDDPWTPKYYNPEILKELNKKFNETIEKRLAKEGPTLIITSRIHERDKTGFLLKGGTDKMWHHLLLPMPEQPTLSNEEIQNVK